MRLTRRPTLQRRISLLADSGLAGLGLDLGRDLSVTDVRLTVPSTDGKHWYDLYFSVEEWEMLTQRITEMLAESGGGRS